MGSAAEKPFQLEQTIVTPLPADPDAWRLEIDEVLTDPDLTNVFLLALKRMQDAEKIAPADRPDWLKPEKTNWLSFYNLAGIHGNPREKWNNINPYNDIKNKEQFHRPFWYCEHGSDVFPQFHRAYLMLFERSLHSAATEVANEYQDPTLKSKYQVAARRLRLPYWDPFTPRNRVSAGENRQNAWGLPRIFQQARVYVRSKTDGKPESIDNPLMRYDFPDKDLMSKNGRVLLDMEQSFGNNQKNDGSPEMTPKEWKMITEARAKGTLRAPGEQGVPNLEGLDLAIKLQGKAMSASVWQMLRSDTNDPNEDRTWERFSNHTALHKRRDNKQWGPTERMTVSLESWHDTIHGLTGSAYYYNEAKDDTDRLSKYDGHMSQVSVAAFDPIFWLHHNNIDRYFAIFQALWPKKYITSSDVKYPEVNMKTWLRPFNVDKNGTKQTQPCTSEEMRCWTQTRFAVPGDKELDSEGEGRKVLQRYLYATNYWGTEPKLKMPEPIEVADAFVFTGQEPKSPPQPRWQQLDYKDGEWKVEQVISKPATPAAPPIQHLALAPTTLSLMVAEPEKTSLPKGSIIPTDEAEAGKSQMWVWNAYFTVQKYALNGSFNVHFFIGSVGNSDPHGFIIQPNEAGFSTIFASRNSDSCERCSENRLAGVEYEDAVPLTPALTEYLRDSPEAPVNALRVLDSLAPEEVAAFLEKNLKWRITDTAGNLKSTDDIARAELEVSVWARVFDRPTQENPMGRYGPATVYPEATRGKPGGYNGEPVNGQ